MERPSPANGYQSGHAALLLASFRRFVGRPLLDPGLAAAEWARALFEAPIVVVSHDAGADPVLTYGNAAALALWEADWEAFTRTPSRLTAEAVHRDERARMLRETELRGFIDNYEGIQISATGRRFRISDAIVWTLVDANGGKLGQAATFSAVAFL